MSHVTVMMNGSCHDPQLGPATLMKESCHTYEGVVSHFWRSHVSLKGESCLT